MEQEYSGKNTLVERIKKAYQSISVPALLIRKYSRKDFLIKGSDNKDIDVWFREMKYNFFPVPKYSLKLVKIKDLSQERMKNKEAREYFRRVEFERQKREHERLYGGPYSLMSPAMREITERIKQIRKEGREIIELKAKENNSDITDKL